MGIGLRARRPAAAHPARGPAAALPARPCAVFAAVGFLVLGITGCTPAATSPPSLGPVATASIEAPASGSPTP